jgi:hypothetical protein
MPIIDRILSKELANVLNIENRYEVDYDEVLKRVKWYLYQKYVCHDLICNKCDYYKMCLKTFTCGKQNTYYSLLSFVPHSNCKLMQVLKPNPLHDSQIIKMSEIGPLVDNQFLVFLSDELADFMGLPHGSCTSYMRPTQYVIDYIEKNELNPNKKIFYPDDKLISLFKFSLYTFVYYKHIQLYINSSNHFLTTKYRTTLLRFKESFYLSKFREKFILWRNIARENIELRLFHTVEKMLEDKRTGLRQRRNK